MELYEWKERTAEERKKTGKVAATEHADILNVQLAAGEGIPEHTSQHPVVIVVQSGRVLFTVEGNELELAPNKLLTIEPNELHALTAVEDCSLVVLKLKK